MIERVCVMRLYKIYSFHSCRVIASHLTLARAKELAGPFGHSACVQPMAAADYSKEPVR